MLFALTSTTNTIGAAVAVAELEDSLSFFYRNDDKLGSEDRIQVKKDLGE